jgi:hypothetical protein
MRWLVVAERYKDSRGSASRRSKTLTVADRPKLSCCS